MPFPNRKRYAEFSYRISRFQAGFDKISGFQSRIAAGFQDFKTDFRIYARFQDLQRDFKISRQISGFTPDFKISAQIYGFHSDLRGISEKVYEISRSGGPLASTPLGSITHA